MDVKSGPVRKTLNMKDANISGFTVLHYMIINTVYMARLLGGGRPPLLHY